MYVCTYIYVYACLSMYILDFETYVNKNPEATIIRKVLIACLLLCAKQMLYMQIKLKGQNEERGITGFWFGNIYLEILAINFE